MKLPRATVREWRGLTDDMPKDSFGLIPLAKESKGHEYVSYGIPGSIDTPEMDAMLAKSMEVLSDEEWEKAACQETLSLWIDGETFTATED